jgi:hypothetical protein
MPFGACRVPADRLLVRLDAHRHKVLRWLEDTCEPFTNNTSATSRECRTAARAVAATPAATRPAATASDTTLRPGITRRWHRDPSPAGSRVRSHAPCGRRYAGSLGRRCSLTQAAAPAARQRETANRTDTTSKVRAGRNPCGAIKRGQRPCTACFSCVAGSSVTGCPHPQGPQQRRRTARIGANRVLVITLGMSPLLDRNHQGAAADATWMSGVGRWMQERPGG